MGATKYDWTDKTKAGLGKEEYDALWTEVNAIPTTYDIDDLDDVVITSVADHELLTWDAGTSKWINMTPTEAGLDAIYLKLNASNDPITDTLEISHATAATLVLNDTGGTQIDISSVADRLLFKVDTVTKFRYRADDNAFELPLATAEPDALLTAAAAFYEDSADDQLWVQWKPTGGGTHHAMVAHAKRTVVSLPGAACIRDAAVIDHIGGTSTDVGSIQFPDGSSTNAVWTFRRPVDWDYGKIRVTLYWANMTAAVTGVHYIAQRMTGWADGEDYSAGNGNVLIAGSHSITGLNNQGKIGLYFIDDSASVTLTGEDFFHYRIQRQGAHGSDTSSQPWHLSLLSFELIAV